MKLGDINNFIGDIDLELLDQLLKGRFNDRHFMLEIGCGQGKADQHHQGAGNYHFFPTYCRART